MSVHAAGNGTRVFYDGHCRPFLRLRDGTHPLAARIRDPGLLHRTGRSDRQRRWVPKSLGPGRSIRRTTSRRQPIRRPSRDPGPTLRPHHRKPAEAGPNHHPHPPCRLFAALRAQALAPRQAQIRRIWRVGACDHLCTATVVTLVFLTGIDGAGDRSRRPDHPRRLVAAVPVGLGSPPQVSGGVIPGGLSQLLGSGCPSGLPPAARNRAPPPPGAKSPRDHAGQPGGNRSRLAGCS